MSITIKFFATLRDKAKTSEIKMDLEYPATVEIVLSKISMLYPEIIPALDTAIVAVNREYAFPEEEVQEGDVIALFPPVSGGSQIFQELFIITDEQISTDALLEQLLTPETGGTCIFTGSVRGQTSMENEVLTTLELEYDAYKPMAEEKMRQIAVEIRQQYPDIHGIAIVQRIGKLSVGEMTTAIVCTAAHRDRGIFEAARYGIDRLKEIVPVWKKEIGPDGSSWVEGQYRPTPGDKTTT